MSQSLGTRWWLILVQGLLLIILSIYIFNNPAGVLAGISFWFGVIVLAAGLVGIIAWFASSKIERESFSLLWAYNYFWFWVIFPAQFISRHENHYCGSWIVVPFIWSIPFKHWLAAEKI